MAARAAPPPPLPELDRSADEHTTLTEMLDFHRTVLARKTHGLDRIQMTTAVRPSELTIAGMVLHMALVEDSWFDHRFRGHDEIEPWASIPWNDDHDWEFHNAHLWNTDDLLTLFRESIERSRAAVGAAASLDQIAALTRSDGTRWNLRWIMVHMIEEYARHCGHLDLIRESIDGATGN